jgi:adenosylcobinamide kinase/adenosylcobinamide-phosphate guanylyltransferase
MLVAQQSEATIFDQVEQLIAASANANLIVVTNEVGCGIVPETDLGRLFRDLQGFANQRLASVADSVYLVVCGIPLRIKPAL